VSVGQLCNISLLGPALIRVGGRLLRKREKKNFF